VTHRREQEVYKLTGQDMQTHGDLWDPCNCQWAIGVPAPRLSGEGPLCGPGHYHAYTHPLLAVALNPIFGDIKTPRLFRGLGEVSRTDHGLKLGCYTMTLVAEEPLPIIPRASLVRWAIYLGRECSGPSKPAWEMWADAWLSGLDRSVRAARAQAAEWEAARAAGAAAAEVAALAAAEAAAWSAEAAWAAEAAEAAWVAWAAEAAWAAKAWAAEAGCAAAGKTLDLVGLLQRAMAEEAERERQG
jgi:hypothetical protein